ncbi:hypothetical protein [Halorubrum laminariae]|uniref:Transmembrane protein n=1 Tax=Halorubrum laminariae TaxID=1433523 RepID=A0ABD6C3S8_9EURY|nr:hypothetical protein [Halorubrum laminariae]
MNARSLSRVAIVGTLAVVLVATLVLSGAGMVLDDPEQRAEDDADETAIEGIVVAEGSVTVETTDGQTIGRSAGEEYFMYGASALAGLLVLVLLLDTWTLRTRKLRVDPRA